MNVPEGWEVKPFSALASINMGQSPDSEFVNESQDGIPFLQGNAEFGNINPMELYWVTVPKKIAKQGDILISVRAPVGDMNLADKSYCIGRGLAALTITKLDNEFGFYSLFQEKVQLDRLAQGSTFLAISKNDFGKLLIKYPKEIKEQQKIAKVLSTLDKTIESTAKLIDKEKNIKKGLMHDLLTNGIDKNNKIRTPQTHKYKQSELGLIPEEWEVVSLEEVGNVVTGNTPSTDNEEFYNGNVPFIGPVDFKGQKYIVKTEKTVSQEGLKYSREISEKAILTVCIGSTIGKIALTIKQCCTNQQINALMCNKKYYYGFVFYAMNQFLQRQLDTEAGLQAVPIVNKSSFSKLLLPCPLDIEEQKKTAKILTTQDKKIEKEEANLAKLKELKKGLMNDLLSGNVRVR